MDGRNWEHIILIFSCYTWSGIFQGGFWLTEDVYFKYTAASKRKKDIYTEPIEKLKLNHKWAFQIIIN